MTKKECNCRVSVESHDGMNGLHDGFDAFYNSVADALALRRPCAGVRLYCEAYRDTKRLYLNG